MSDTPELQRIELTPAVSLMWKPIPQSLNSSNTSCASRTFPLLADLKPSIDLCALICQFIGLTGNVGIACVW